MRIELVNSAGNVIESLIYGDDDAVMTHAEFDSWCVTHSVRALAKLSARGDTLSWARVICAGEWLSYQSRLRALQNGGAPPR